MHENSLLISSRGLAVVQENMKIFNNDYNKWRERIINHSTSSWDSDQI